MLCDVKVILKNQNKEIVMYCPPYAPVIIPMVFKKMPQNAQSAQIVKPHFDELESTRPASIFYFILFFLPSLQCTCAKMFGQEFRAWTRNFDLLGHETKAHPTIFKGPQDLSLDLKISKARPQQRTPFTCPCTRFPSPHPFWNLQLRGILEFKFTFYPKLFLLLQSFFFLNCGWGAVEAHVLLLRNMMCDYYYQHPQSLISVGYDSEFRLAIMYVSYVMRMAVFFYR